jgi:uncharacterized SAM-binding protein YcdF (DUF218 family)
MEVETGPRPGTVRKRRWWRWFLVVASVFFAGWILRYPMLRGLGNFLITADPVVPVDEVFVLGGAIVDRGQEAARVYAQGISDRFIFTGAPIPTALEGLGIDSTEAECTRNEAVRYGLPLARTVALNKGTSTFEEAEALLAQAQADGADSVMVISSCFHLRRVGFVFKERFRKAGITVLLHGAPATTFREDAWWRSEDGLIMVANEYIKLVYYRMKYSES